jgi:hypothetical protein
MAKYWKLNDKTRAYTLLHVSLTDLVVPVNEMGQKSTIDYDINSNKAKVKLFRCLTN